MAGFRCLLVFGLVMLVLGGAVSCRSAPRAGEAQEAAAFLAKSRAIRGALDYQWQLAERVVPDAAARGDVSLPTLDGRWAWMDGELVAASGDTNRTVVLARGGDDPVRVEVDVTLEPVPASPDGRVGDITLLLNAVSGAGYWQSGYALTTGSFWDHCTTFYRKGSALARTEHSPVEPGARHSVAVEYAEGHIRYWLDGEVVLEAWDPQPLSMSDDRWIALRTWNTRMVVHGARVYEAATVEEQRKK